MRQRDFQSDREERNPGEASSSKQHARQQQQQQQSQPSPSTDKKPRETKQQMEKPAYDEVENDKASKADENNTKGDNNASMANRIIILLQMMMLH